jgi:hypothetical protein
MHERTEWKVISIIDSRDETERQRRNGGVERQEEKRKIRRKRDDDSRKSYGRHLSRRILT